MPKGVYPRKKKFLARRTKKDILNRQITEFKTPSPLPRGKYTAYLTAKRKRKPEWRVHNPALAKHIKRIIKQLTHLVMEIS